MLLYHFSEPTSEFYAPADGEIDLISLLWETSIQPNFGFGLSPK